MSFKFKCPVCQHELEAEEAWCGMELQCPACQQKIVVPQCTQTTSTTTLKSANAELSLYSPNAAGLWSLLFSAVFGSWCIWQNYKTIGDEKAAKRSMIWVVGLFLVLLILLFLPTYCRGFGIVLLIVWYCFEQRTQVKYLQVNNIAYTKKSWGKPVTVAIIIVIILGYVTAQASKAATLIGG